jgi:hypothetical protein
MAYALGDHRGARGWFEQAAGHWRKLGDRAGLGAALPYYGRIVAAAAEIAAEYEQGKALMQEAIAINRQAGILWWTANGLSYLGLSASEHAELKLAATALLEAEAIGTQLEDRHRAATISRS